MEKIQQKKSKIKIIKIAAIIVPILVSLVGVYIKISEHYHQKKLDYNQAYLNTLSNIESGDLIIQKASILEICNFTNKYSNIIPFLIDFLETQINKGDDYLNQTLLTAFIKIGEPMFQELANVNRKTFGNNESRFNASQWAIVELIKNDIGSADFHKITLNDIELKNFKIIGVSLNGANITNANFSGTTFIDVDFSDAFLTNCLFWKTKFIGSSDLNKTIFENCTFRDSNLDCNLKDTNFPNSTWESDSNIPSPF